MASVICAAAAFCSSMDLFIVMSCSTVENWASCAAMSLPSIGLSGS
jgi:hypothetical protein